LRLLAGPLAALLLAAPPSLAQQAIEKRAELCFVCHGDGGRSRTPLIPSLAGQPGFFVVAQLFLFRDGRRGTATAVMYDAARHLSNDDLRAFGDFFSHLPPPAPPAEAPEPARFARGRALASEQHCMNCHNPDFSGREQMPRLANQREDYLLKTMRDYKSGARIGYGNAAMSEVVSGLNDADMAALAHFLAYLPAPGTGGRSSSPP